MRMFLIELNDAEIIRYAEIFDGGPAGFYIRIKDLTNPEKTMVTFLDSDGVYYANHTCYYPSEKSAINFLTSWIDKQQHQRVADKGVTSSENFRPNDMSYNDWVEFGYEEENKKVAGKFANHNSLIDWGKERSNPVGDNAFSGLLDHDLDEF